MNQIIVVVVEVVSFILLLVIFATSYLRSVKPHSKKMTEELTQLRKKSAVTTEKTGEKKGDGGIFKYLKLNLWSILIIPAGTWLMYWGFNNHQIRPADVGSWSQNYWFPILICWGTGAVIIKINEKSFGTAAKTLQWILAVMVFIVLIGFPVWSWLAKPNSHSGACSEIPLASEPVSAWPKLVMPAGGKSKNVPVPQGMHVVMNGEDFHFHCVYLNGHDISFGKGGSCPSGNMPFVYATNDRVDEQNIVSYAYEKK